jgi:hypothetical protein
MGIKSPFFESKKGLNLINSGALFLIGSSTAAGFGIDRDKSYFSLCLQRYPSLIGLNASQDLISISQIVATVKESQYLNSNTVLIIHSAADGYLVPTFPLKLYSRVKSWTADSASGFDGYLIYRKMNRLPKSLFLLARFLKPRTSLLSLFRSFKSVNMLAVRSRHIFVIVDSTFRMSPEWIFRSCHSRIVVRMFQDSKKVSTIDLRKIVNQSSFTQADILQGDNWHLNALGHSLLADKIASGLSDLRLNS